MGRALAALIVVPLLSLPLAASALIVLTVPPAGPLLPDALVRALRPGAALVFQLIGLLPPDSLAGRAFYGSYGPLAERFGGAALALHSALSALLWAALVLLVARVLSGQLPRARTPRS